MEVSGQPHTAVTLSLGKNLMVSTEEEAGEKQVYNQ